MAKFATESLAHLPAEQDSEHGKGGSPKDVIFSGKGFSMLDESCFYCYGRLSSLSLLESLGRCIVAITESFEIL